MTAVTDNVEWHDVQGLVLSGYPRLRYSAFLLLRFLPDGPDQRAAAKQWLARLARLLVRADKADAEAEPDAVRDTPSPITNLTAMKTRSASSAWAINLALTARGLQRLGVGRHELAHFSQEFLEGMAPLPNGTHAIPRRCNLLGDVGDNSPDCWHWGGWEANREIDGVLLLYAGTKDSLQALIAAETAHMQPAAEPILSDSPKLTGRLILPGRVFCDGKEHFGFKDGISQPIIEGTRIAARAKKRNPKEFRISVVKAGEFVLGYPNERNAAVSFANNPARTSSDSEADGAPVRDLGRNGTYLVLRQLEQDVQAFDSFVTKAAQQVHGEANARTKEWVASRLIGRLPNGEPLIGPAADAAETAGPRNDFLYHFEDGHGLTCPIGAHIRRANPRDTIGPNPDAALRLSKMHRIIRRGRPYGERPSSEGLRAEGAAGTDEPRGIYFIGLNADIAGQFEMIQHSWLNNVHFGGLYAGTDPLSHFRAGGDVMTIQARPANLHIEGMAPFVTVRGGAYFFLPGIKALEALAL